MQGWSLSAIYISGSHGDAVHADDGVAFICGCLYETLNRPRKASIQNNSISNNTRYILYDATE